MKISDVKVGDSVATVIRVGVNSISVCFNGVDCWACHNNKRQIFEYYSGRNNILNDFISVAYQDEKI